MRWAIWALVVLVGSAASGSETLPALVRIGVPVGGHIHPSICRTPRGTLVVIYGRVNHRDLRVSRSTDQGQSWSEPEPFAHTIGKTYYPGSLTALSDGRILHAWNRWSADDNEQEPRSVLFALSDDEGATWTAPRPFLSADPARGVIRHPIVELDADHWLVTTAGQTFVYRPSTGTTEPWGDGREHGAVPLVRTPRGTFISGQGLRSTDQGQTWEPIENFPNLSEQGWRHEMVCLANGWLLASEVVGPGFGGDRLQYAISRDDGLTWSDRFEYYNPGRPIGGRACPRTVQMDDRTIGVVFYDIDPDQPGGPGVFFLTIPLADLGP